MIACSDGRCTLQGPVTANNVVSLLAQGAERFTEPRVTVASSHAEGIVRLTVADNGCGVPEHVMRRAFDRPG